MKKVIIGMSFILVLVTLISLSAVQNRQFKSQNFYAYMIAFDKTWEIDTGLNQEIKYISINTKSFKNFSKSDKEALFNYLSDKYRVKILDMNIQELKDKGYVKNLYFKDGIEFEINKYNHVSNDYIAFSGMKWRSGLGAIGFEFTARKGFFGWNAEGFGVNWIS